MKKFTRILIPTDGSEHAELAIETGISVAREYGADVVGLYVKDLMFLTQFPEDRDIIALNNGLKEEGTLALKFLEEKAGKGGVGYTGKIVEGHTAELILKVAEEEGCDLIVMGTIGRSRLKRLLLGSVAENVVRHAHCPVMVVRTHANG